MDMDEVHEYQDIAAELFRWLDRNYQDLYELGEAIQKKVVKQ